MIKEGRPIVIRRVVEEAHAGHHGGAWKVAYADFVTAMMAFFLLLWLISSASEDTLKGLAEFFSDATVNTGPPGGIGGTQGLTLAPGALPQIPSSPFAVQPTIPFSPEQDDAEVLALGHGEEGDADDPGAAAEISDAALKAELARREQMQLERARATILDVLEASPELRLFKDNLLIDQTPEGLRIQLLDRDSLAMFPLGSDAMYPHMRRLLQVVAEAIAGLPNRLSIRGHTDALPFAPGTAYDNWRLSSDRANATRLALAELGLGDRRVAEVVGKGDADPLVQDDPQDARNRRISIVLLQEGRKDRPASRGSSDSLPVP